MKLMKEFYIKDKLWRLEFKRAFTEDGLADQTNRVITLRHEIPKAEKPETFLHEFFHGCFFELHLSGPSGVLSPEIEEIMCAGLAHIFINTFDLKWKKRRG